MNFFTTQSPLFNPWRLALLSFCISECGLAQNASLDSTFGSAGIVFIPDTSNVNAVCVRADNRIAVIGQSTQDAAFMQFRLLNANGSFASSASPPVPVGTSSIGNISIRGDCIGERLVFSRVVAGAGSDQNLQVLQHSSTNGVLLATTTLNLDDYFPNQLADAEVHTGLNGTLIGNVMLTGFAQSSIAGVRSFIAKILPNGNIDAINPYGNGVGTSGTFNFHTAAVPYGAVVGPDGNFWIAGEGVSQSFSQSRTFVMRANAGSLAITSVSDAIAPPPPPDVTNPDIGRASVMSSNGSFVASRLIIDGQFNGTTLRTPAIRSERSGGFSNLIALPRAKNQFQVDLTLNASSTRSLSLGNNAVLYIASTMPYSQNDGGSGFYFAKVKVDSMATASLDTGFGTNGAWTLNFDSPPDCGAPETLLSVINGATFVNDQVLVYGRYNSDCQGSRGFVAVLSGKAPLFKNGFE